MARREFPRKIKAAAIIRAAGKCERCKTVLKKGGVEVDHILEDALGGEPVLANAQVLCRPCHAEKTAERIVKIRKADRQGDKASGAIRPKQTIRSAPFAKSEKPAAKPLPPRRSLFERSQTP